jgi:hypothetical protein
VVITAPVRNPVSSNTAFSTESRRRSAGLAWAFGPGNLDLRRTRRSRRAAALVL